MHALGLTCDVTWSESNSMFSVMLVFMNKIGVCQLCELNETENEMHFALHNSLYHSIISFVGPC